jgi:GH24 family phage-related lysozyme (muramidase)
MALRTEVKKELYINLEKYEGRFEHIYLDTKGRVTVGVGHLIPNRAAMGTLVFFKTKDGQITTVASLQEKQAEYDAVAKLRWGQRYGAASFKPKTSLVMRSEHINQLLDRHIDSFYKELTNIYKKSNGYIDDFDNLHSNVQLALFDMIFNLGASKIVNVFPSFDTAIKKGDWKKAASEANRPDVSSARNQYVKQLLLSVPAAVATP